VKLEQQPVDTTARARHAEGKRGEIMRTVTVLLAAVCATFMSAPSFADGLIRKLPKDGSWAKYHVTLKASNVDHSGTAVLRSVGAVVEKDKACRWIEVEFTPALAAQGAVTIYKLLIPEEHLKAGIDPFDHIVRAWEKEGDEKPRLLDDPSSLDRNLLGAVFHGPLDKEQPLAAEKEFPYQRGKLQTRGVSGRRRVEFDNLKGTLASTMWVHGDVPFGVAALDVEFRIDDNPEVLRIQLVIDDFGTGATSALPDAR
jgi:hypothetical protein